jgi:predicted amidophosphoribosyltransferase
LTELERKRFRVKNGLCPKCGRPNNGSRVLCEVCAGRQRKKYHTRKDNGLCVVCGTPIDNGRTRCPNCLEKERNRSRELYRYDITHGICTRCHKFTAKPGRTKCEVCLAYEAERLRKKRIDRKRTEGLQKSQQAMYELRKADGS